ncbi:hypothetical protein JYU34_019670 [Plutella xylostella]|uniref:Nucleolar protein 14 n=1 Tax=Plutella xylostella TaxID=51655 RepID=A0ABQ7PXA0_PLUXY|nr:hypothetical protein JYU34_019670 [Plutella xylostella]
MAKAKNKRNSGLADKVHNKRKGDVHKKKLNPFEVHINREKMKVLGQKSKHERGMPGVARARAVQKRKETLGTEMKLMHKTNVFTDRRIGEKDSALSAEERATARFAAERARRPRPALYNLADDELLTHRGQTLEQIEKFDDPRSSDDEDEDDGRKAFRGLDDEFVSEGHFGGGMLSRGAGGGAGGAGGGARSHQDLIDQLIADSKRRKADKQKLKEQTLDLTEKLDSEWRDLQPVVAKRARAASPAPAPAPGDPPLTRAERAALDYDQMTRELRFEKRGTPSDGLKSQEAQEEEERKQLAAWQRERDRRMRGEEGEGAAPAHTHRSAEDLDDNLELEAAAPGFMLAYDDEGRALGDEAVLTQHSGFPSEKKQFQDGGSDDSSDEEEREEGSSEGGDDDDDDDDDDEQTAADKTSTKKIDKKSKEAKPNETSILFQKQTSDEDDDDEDEDEGKNGGDDDKDNETTDDDDDDETEEKNSEKDNHSKKMNSIKTNGLPKEDSSESDSDSDTEPAESEKINENKVDDISNLRVLLESVAESEDEEQRAEDDQRISTFFKTMSTEGYKLKALLSDKSPAAQAAALARLVKQYDPSKGEGNKEKLSQLFPYVVQFIHDAWGAPSSAAGVSHAARTLHHLAPILYDLAKVNKVSSMKCIVEVLKEKHDLFLKCPKRVPDLDTLVLFKLVSLLYPGSDYRHPVATPALVFMQQILTRGRFRDPQSISRGLFVAALILEYTALSKRLVPPVINFLRGLLYMAADIPIVSQLQVVPPFRARDAGLLRVSADCPPLSGADKMAAGDLFTDEFTDELKVRVISTCVNMLRELFDNSSDLEAQECIFRPHLQLLALVRLPPAPAAAPAPAALDYMTRALEVKTYTHMCGEKKKTKMLRLYEPDVQDVFTGSKSAKLSVEASSRARLTGRLRRERRGAARELRRDAAYLAGEKLRGKIRSDNERKAKVKRIYAEAALQQGELNALKRQK